MTVCGRWKGGTIRREANSSGPRAPGRAGGENGRPDPGPVALRSDDGPAPGPNRLTSPHSPPRFRVSAPEKNFFGLPQGESWLAPALSGGNQLWPRSPKARPRKRWRSASPSGKGEVLSGRSRRFDGGSWRRPSDIGGLQVGMMPARQNARRQDETSAKLRSRSGRGASRTFDLAACRS